jgi:protein phosphatase
VAERATADPRASGMGSTVTAALVGRGVVTFAHVGDSRAYLWRSGALTRLSDDHSLVAEWVRAGALAPEEAAQHPQRSVITRALGADWQIDIDVWTTPVRTGDVILLCTDGLSGFVDDTAVARTLKQHSSLDAAVHALIDAANAAGGEDNITAVALRLEAEEGEPEAGEETGEVVDERPTGTLEAVVPEALVPDEATGPGPGATPESIAEPAPGATAVALAAPPAAADAPEPLETPAERAVPAPLPAHGETLITVPALVTGFGSGSPMRRRGPARRLGVFAAVVALMLCVLWAALIGLRWSHFVGVDPATGRVAVYQGVPYDLGGGVKLFSLVHRSRVPAATLPAARRRHLFDHSLRSSESARSLVARLEQTEP